MWSDFMQESPTPTKLITPFTLGLTDSRRPKLTAEKHQVDFLFRFCPKSYAFSLGSCHV